MIDVAVTSSPVKVCFSAPVYLYSIRAYKRTRDNKASCPAPWIPRRALDFETSRL